MSNEKPQVEYAQAELNESDPIESSEKPLFDIELALAGNQLEHKLNARDAFRVYWKGVLWSMFISLAIIMRAYDIEILGNFYALASFQQKYGKFVEKTGGYQVPAKWQVAMNMGTYVGQIIGAWMINFPMERYGRKKTFAVNLCLTSAFVFMEFFAPSVQVLTVAQFVLGIIWGGLPIIIISYATEVLPLGLRHYLTGYVNLCYVMGQFICTGVIRGFVNRTDEWAYRIPFALQWFWPVLLLSGLVLAPESPWWLIRKDRMNDVRNSLKRLTTNMSEDDLEKTIALMLKTNQLEEELTKDVAYRDCFKGANRRRSEILIVVWLIQDFSGNPVGYASYFFEQVGLNSEQSFDMGVGLNAMGFVATILSIIPITYLGHRFTFTYGLALIVGLLYIVALLSFGKNYKETPAYGWTQACLLIVVQFFWQLTQGPLTYIIGAEVASTRLRSHTLSIAAIVDAGVAIATTVLGPYLLNPGAINAGAKTEFLYAGISTFSVVWCYFRLPEMKGRTFEELDIMFERKVPTRQFKTYVIDQDELIHARQELVEHRWE
jgi:SP family general alpha glucoside:H+ symporter-like MFS transporter